MEPSDHEGEEVLMQVGPSRWRTVVRRFVSKAAGTEDDGRRRLARRVA
jgi:hypothetical protein